MQPIEGYDKVRQHWPEFKFNYLSEINEMVLRCSEGKSRLDLTMSSARRLPGYSVTLRFSGVSALNISDFGSALIQVMGFDVSDISDRQWEGINWEVYDFENGALRFYAESVVIVNIEKIEGR